MADVGGRPFLEHLLRYLAACGVGRFILSVGYKHEIVRRHFGACFVEVPIVYSVEEEPLGTGGAVYRALRHVEGPNALALNGDTFFRLDPVALLQHHAARAAHVTVGLRWMEDTARYGTLEIEDDRIVAFQEKERAASGYINGGVYGINKQLLERFPFQGAFSFETDLLQRRCGELKLCPYVSDGYFIDIGIPKDYQKAQNELAAELLENP
jgi:D-glycero-alpha-D-manno-heptose 1-phosphate guanylyltransferase